MHVCVRACVYMRAYRSKDPMQEGVQKGGEEKPFLAELNGAK